MSFRLVKRIFVLVVVLLVLLAVLVTCYPAAEESVPAVLQDLTYAEGKEEEDYTVYLEESGELVPYLVLTDRYAQTDGLCLLLRKYLLEDTCSYNEDSSAASYYADSQIDTYLNKEFKATLASALREQLCSASVPITARDSLGCSGADTETIPRDIFLLSAVEAGGISSSSVPAEGEALAYFRNDARRIARTADGTPGSWWLRTPDTRYNSVVCGVERTGAIGIGGVDRFGEGDSGQNGVRPALCLDGSTQITQADGQYLLADLS